jgi:hypothetical protein
VAKRKTSRLGKLPPRYAFILNPYVDVRFSKCPKCEKLTYPRKFALLIHIDGADPLVLGKTCKYCSQCELIIAHKDELEALLAGHFSAVDSDVVGNKFLVLATVDLTFWKAAMANAVSFAETLDHTAQIKKYLDVTYRPARWYPANS